MKNQRVKQTLPFLLGQLKIFKGILHQTVFAEFCCEHLMKFFQVLKLVQNIIILLGIHSKPQLKWIHAYLLCCMIPYNKQPRFVG